MKFGKVKREHSRVGGLDALLDRIMRDCPHVSRIVPGRIKRRRGNDAIAFKVQYATPSGLKCIYTGTGTVQEVFLVTNDEAATRAWLASEEIVA
jgi:hypothetical protein